MVGSPLIAIHAALHAAYHAAANAETEGDSSEEHLAKAVKGALTLEGLCEATGMSADMVTTAMKKAEDVMVHRPYEWTKGPVTETARKDVAFYGLKKHREGQPGWVPAVQE